MECKRGALGMVEKSLTLHKLRSSKTGKKGCFLEHISKATRGFRARNTLQGMGTQAYMCMYMYVYVHICVCMTTGWLFTNGLECDVFQRRKNQDIETCVVFGHRMKQERKNEVREKSEKEESVKVRGDKFEIWRESECRLETYRRRQCPGSWSTLEAWLDRIDRLSKGCIQVFPRGLLNTFLVDTFDILYFDSYCTVARHRIHEDKRNRVYIHNSLHSSRILSHIHIECLEKSYIFVTRVHSLDIRNTFCNSFLLMMWFDLLHIQQVVYHWGKTSHLNSNLLPVHPRMLHLLLLWFVHHLVNQCLVCFLEFLTWSNNPMDLRDIYQ